MAGIASIEELNALLYGAAEAVPDMAHALAALYAPPPPPLPPPAQHAPPAAAPPPAPAPAPPAAVAPPAAPPAAPAPPRPMGLDLMPEVVLTHIAGFLVEPGAPNPLWPKTEVFLTTLPFAMTCHRAFRAVSNGVWLPKCWPAETPLPEEPPPPRLLPSQQQVMQAGVQQLKEWLRAAQLKLTGPKAELQYRLIYALNAGPQAPRWMPLWLMKLFKYLKADRNRRITQTDAMKTCHLARSDMDFAEPPLLRDNHHHPDAAPIKLFLQHECSRLARGRFDGDFGRYLSKTGRKLDPAFHPPPAPTPKVNLGRRSAEAAGGAAPTAAAAAGALDLSRAPETAATYATATTAAAAPAGSGGGRGRRGGGRGRRGRGRGRGRGRAPRGAGESGSEEMDETGSSNRSDSEPDSFGEEEEGEEDEDGGWLPSPSAPRRVPARKRARAEPAAPAAAATVVVPLEVVQLAADEFNLFQHQWAAAARLIAAAQGAPPQEQPTAFVAGPNATQLLFPRLDLYLQWQNLWMMSVASEEGQRIAPVPAHLVEQAVTRQGAAQAQQTQQRSILAAALLANSREALQSAQQQARQESSA
ncbi:hypothetical protein Rsub_01479 [Raphidocelis subcapitata]|uniref:Uncharacterized protein n=1 Tax=Raphidocelis subcapitata TaxID=307507 RepID=A0A2V0NTT6_9CHLO|nr:hypothetical protein Rsub_01479 [Raphidocelis subcapitata]|eukprot:GBF88980.1 hypothetical protein Rsub_01479 [Raphidocelis subcapitata]